MANQNLSPDFWGFIPANVSPSMATFNLNAAGTWLAFGFATGYEAGTASKTINKVRVFIGTITGSLASTDLQCDIFSDSGGQPNASLTSSTNIGGGAPASNTWIEFTGLSAALSPTTHYWVVIRNTNGTPASNFPPVQEGGGSVMPIIAAGNAQTYGWGTKTTTNSGGTWASGNVESSTIRLGFSDGTYAGFPNQNIVAGLDKAELNNEVGVKFTSPATTLNVRGIGFVVQKVGAPSGIFFNLYNGSTLFTNGSTDTIAAGNLPAGACLVCAYFENIIQIPPNTVCRATFSQGNNGSVSNYYKTPTEFQWDSDSNSVLLMPCDGTLIKSTYNGTTFTDTATSVLPFGLLLDSTGEFSGVPLVIPFEG